MNIFLQRRFWVAAIPAIVIAANALGFPITEDLLTSTGDQVIVSVTAVLGLLSYLFPKVGQ